MYTDTGLRLATAEAINLQNAGAAAGAGEINGTLGADSVTLALDFSGVTTVLRQARDIGAGQRMVLNINVDTTVACDTFGATLEIQLVSLPIAASLLQSATTEGKLTRYLAAVTEATNDTITIAGHGLPLGTPFYASADTTSGLTLDSIYYAIPRDANAFQAATSLANALAGTEAALTAGDADIEFLPTIHGSTGSIHLFDVPAATNKHPLQAGEQVQVPLRPLAGHGTKHLPPTSQGGTPVAGELTQQIGAGPGADFIMGSAQRYYYLRYVPSATITAGAVTVDLVVDAGDALTTYATATEVVG